MLFTAVYLIYNFVLRIWNVQFLLGCCYVHSRILDSFWDVDDVWFFLRCLVSSGMLLRSSVFNL